LTTRRRFLQVGIAGAAVLAGVHLARRGADPAPLPGLRTLDAESAAIVAAIVPVVLAGSIPADAAAEARSVHDVVGAFDAAVAGLPPAMRGEVADLLGLLGLAPARYALAGLAVPLPEASREDIAGFLERWRASRFDLLRAGYQGLTQLIQAAWLGNPSSWPAIGYPGPPSLPPS